MPESNPYSLPEDEINPYAPPKADIEAHPLVGSAELVRAEETRRRFLNHEASVQSIGALYILGAIFMGIATVGGILGAVGVLDAARPGAENAPVILGFMAAFYGVLTILFVAVGIGLYKLKTWARWVVVVLTAINIVTSLVYIALIAMAGIQPYVLVVAGITLLIPGYILYLLVSPKASVVFSPEYRHVIEQTPHIKYKTSCLVKVLLIVVLVPIILAVLVAIVSALGRR